MIGGNENWLFWNAGSRFAFVFVKCRGKQESSPSFMFSNMERTKAQQNSFSRMFLGSGGRFIEREVVNTLSIRGYPRALRYLLTMFSKMFCFSCVCGFWKSLFEKFDLTLVSVLKSVWSVCLKTFWKCRCEKLFFCFERASTQEKSTYSKELSCVNVL